ncbi:MAG: hypothetical protein RL378_1007, partial [Actinomycetota bacterium]
ESIENLQKIWDGNNMKSPLLDPLSYEGVVKGFRGESAQSRPRGASIV